MDLRLSIIIPTYNLELYIEKCLKSLLNQDLPLNQYEIIVVNDGSTDSTEFIVAGLVEDNSNIKLINKTNGGVSSARNIGIQEAKGEYITFLDGDDYFVPNILSSILDFVRKDDLQIGLFGIRGEESKIEKFYIENTPIITGIDLYLNHRKYIGDNSCPMLTKREFLISNNLRYTVDIPYLEDGLFVAKLMCLATKCSYNGYPYYTRVIRPGSADTSNIFYTKKAIDGFIKAIDDLKNMQLLSKLTVGQNQFLNQPINKFIKTALGACLTINTVKYLFYVISELKKRGINKINPSNSNIYLFVLKSLLDLASLSIKNKLKGFSL